MKIHYYTILRETFPCGNILRNLMEIFKGFTPELDNNLMNN